MLKKGAKLIRKKANYNRYDAELIKLSKQSEQKFIRRRCNYEMIIDNSNHVEEEKEDT